ncbi:flagellar assembly protein FliW [Paenibacillus sp. GSMTC-2017]|nr:flagellar assembly protein FliW [Paenibacillus sp. GSMTC-2017]
MTTYHFDQGIPGFEHLNKFYFEHVGDNIPMMLMKSTDDKDLSLLVTSPFLFYPDYEWVLSDSTKEELGIMHEGDVEIWSIITIPADPEKSTINLLAPIVLNKTKAVGKQLILHDRNYSSRAPLNRI